MTEGPEPAVPDELVEAALDAAENEGRNVADVSVDVIARRAGMSRSTLLRRLGGSRAALDDAVRARGVDPGGLPVRTRAIEAAGALIEETGLGATTLEAIAARSGCSVPSLYSVFGSRDGLVRAVFERYSPLLAVEEFFATPPDGDLRQVVRALYGVLAEALVRQPRVLPAIFAEAFARPSSPAVQALLGHTVPRLFGAIGGWLIGEVAAGRVRDLPAPLLVQQLMAPLMVHQLFRPVADATRIIELPDVDTVCDVFADTFVRAVGQT